MDKAQIVVGSTTYVYRLIEQKQYIVLERDPDNLDFTFQEKFDKATGKPFFVNVVTRSKVWELPDMAALPPMDPLPKEIAIGCTVYKTCHSADGEVMFAPEKLPIELAAGHCWVPQADRIYGKYTYRNAANGKRSVTLPPTCDFCQRVQRMYATYSLGTTAELRAFLTERAGEEEEALVDLIAKHGPEPKDYLHTKEQICAVFSRYDPRRMPEVIELLEQYEGAAREAELVGSLKAQYGEIPSTYRERIEGIFKQHAPDRLDCVDAVLATFADREVGLIAALVRKHGPEPVAEGATPRTAEAEELRARVVAMLIKHTPNSINATYEQGMAEHKSSEEALLAALVAKYGPEPTAAERDSMFESYLSTPSEPFAGFQPRSPTNGLAAVPIAKPNAYRDRLTRFYAKYNPSKLGSIDKMLRRYEGSEEQLMAELVKTYGPEPEADPAVAVNAEAVAAPTETSAEAATPAAADVPSTAAVAEPSKEATHVDPTAEAPHQPTTVAAAAGTAVAPTTPSANALLLPSPNLGATPAPAAAPMATPQSPRHFELSDEELRRRVTNMITVHDPDTIEAVTTMMTAMGAPLALYNELLERHGRDPTPEEVADAEARLQQRREEEVALRLQAEEEARLAKEAEQQRMSALVAEMEALRVHEAERVRADEERRLKDTADRERQLAALEVLSEAEARRKAAEQAVEAVARTSEFAAHDEGEEERYLDQGLRGGVGATAMLNRTSPSMGDDAPTTVVTASMAALDTTTLIGTLAALEEKLQRAYNQMEVSIRKGDALRKANEELHHELNDQRNLLADRERDMQIALIEAKNESDRIANEQEKEKLTMRAGEQEARAEILANFREEQRKMNDDMLRMANESRELNEEVSRQRGDIRELERNIRTLQARLADKEASELEARAKLRVLEESIAAKPRADTNFTQTDDTDVFSSQVFTSPMPMYTKAQAATMDELQLTVHELEEEVSAWRLRFVEVQAEAETTRAQQMRVAEEYDTSLRVINMLRAKNKKLEEHCRALDLQMNATSGKAADASLVSMMGRTPTRGGYEPSAFGGGNSTPRTTASLHTPRTVVSPSQNSGQRGGVFSPNAAAARGVASPVGLSASGSVVPAVDLSPLSGVELKRRLAASDAESRTLRKEIQDLRGLLALHMSNPRKR